MRIKSNFRTIDNAAILQSLISRRPDDCIMSTRALTLAAMGIGAAISAAAVALYLASAPGGGFDPPALDFDYSMNSQISDTLAGRDVSMSSPITASQAFDVQRYCTFFDDPEKQSQIRYCTSTELLDGNGHFLGNVHMVGTPESPKLVIAILEASLDEAGTVSAVFDAVIDNTVCECWENLSPGGFPSVSGWVDAMGDFHRQATSETTTKSAVLVLDDLKVQSEITSIEGAYVWKLFVAG